MIAKHPEQTKIEWYKCDICDYQTKHKNTIRLHKKTHMDDIDDKVTCDICKLSLSKKCLSTHMKNVHGEERKLYACEVCDFQTKYSQELSRHTNAVHLGLRHRCELCGKDFARPGDLTAHKKKMH